MVFVFPEIDRAGEVTLGIGFGAIHIDQQYRAFGDGLFQILDADVRIFFIGGKYGGRDGGKAKGKDGKNGFHDLKGFSIQNDKRSDFLVDFRFEISKLRRQVPFYQYPMADSRMTREQPPLPFKAVMIGWAAATLIRVVSLTLRWRMEDRAKISENPPEGQMIWVFWHNRIFVVPVAYRKYLKSRSGAVLTSASNDGAIIAATVKCFGADAVRGSTSRRGVAALLGLVEWVKGGFDVAITPDGPRGPRYRLAPGLIKLAQTTGASILPIRIEYSSFWSFRSWDKFRVPKPFSRVTVIFEPLEMIDPAVEGDSFEAERKRVQQILNPTNETD